MKTKPIWMMILIFTLAAVLPASIYQKKFQTPRDWDETLYDWKIDAASDVRLLKTELITDETGVTTEHMSEKIVGDTWIRKDFLLDAVQADTALLLFHCTLFDFQDFTKAGGYLWVTVNDRPIKLVPDVARMLTGGWVRCDVPSDLLKPGLNTVVIHNETDVPFPLSVEASRIPNRSAKSVDGGKTWDYDHLGPDGFIDGEYLVRLRLGRYAEKGEIKSDFIETASLVSGAPVKPRVRLQSLKIDLEKETPAGTSLFLQARGGTTPSYAPKTWSPWQTPDELTPAVLGGWTFFQWRIELRTADRRVTPVLKGVTVDAGIDTLAKNDLAKVTADDNQKIVRGYYPYAFQDSAEPRLAVLKNRYRLEEVVGGCSSEFQKFRVLAFWLKGIWRDGWGKQHRDELHTPWDALIALELAPQYKAAGMCTIYSNTFVQTALSLGLQARGVVLDHHFVSEAWSNELKKWVTFDVGNNMNSLRSAFHVKDEIPLNALETHRLVNEGKLNQLWIVPVGPQDRVNAADGDKEGLWGPIWWKQRFGMPLRNNYLTSWLPGELEHGFIQYHYDGYLWWKDSPIPKYEEYTLHSSHPRDFYWTINQAQIFLSATERNDELAVTLDTVTPNFLKFQVRIDTGEWKDSPASFTWKLHGGGNTLSARPVNRFGKEGITSEISIKIK